MKLIHKVASGAAAVAIFAGIGGTAWGYGVEGWPQGRPDHVIQAEQRQQKVKERPAMKAPESTYVQQRASVESAPAAKTVPTATPATPTVQQMEQPQASAKKAVEGVVTVTGRNYCVSCRAWKKGDMHSECVKNGHSMIFRVREARDGQGQVIPDLEGRVLHYTANENAQRLSTSKDYLNKIVTLKGALSSDRRILTVSEVEPTPKVK